MNEKKEQAKETQTVSGAGSVQPEARTEEGLLSDIAFYAKEEADLFAKRGYGGYIDTGDLERQREQCAFYVAQLPPTHQTRQAFEKVARRRH